MDNSQSQPSNTFANSIHAGTAAFDLGNYCEAGKAFKEACEIADRQQNKSDQSQALLLLGKVRRVEGQYEPAFSSLKQALELRTHLFGERSLQTAEVLNELGCTEYDAGALEESDRHLSQALEIRQSFPQNELELAESYSNFGLLLMRLERISEAEPMLSKSLGIRKRLLPMRHTIIAESLLSLAELQLNKGSTVLSLPLAEEACQIYESKFGKQHPKTAQAMHTRAVLYQQAGKFKEAEKLFESAIKIEEEKLPEGHPRTISSINEYAATYLRLGKAKEAKEQYEKALSLCHKNETVGDETSMISLVGLGVSNLEQHEYKQAEVHIKQALSMLDRVRKNVVFLEKSLLYNLLHSLIWQGKFGDALRLVPDTVRAREAANVAEMAEMLNKLYEMATSKESKG